MLASDSEPEALGDLPTFTVLAVFEDLPIGGTGPDSS